MNKVLQKVLLGMTLTAIFGGGATLAKADDVNTSSDSSGVNNVLANDSNSTQSTQASKTSLADQISSTSQAAQVLTKLQAATSTSESSSTSYLNAETSSTNQITTRNVEEPSSNTDSSSSSSSVAEIATSSATASVGSDTASQASQTGKVLADGSANADTVKKAPRNNNTQAAKHAASTLATTMKGASQNNLTFYNDVDEAVVGFNGNNIYNRGYNYSYDNLDTVKYSSDTRNDKAQVINDYANLTDSELKEVNFFAAQLLNTARQSVWAVNGQDSNTWQLMITKDSLGLAVKVAQGYTRDRHSISTGTHDTAVLKQAYSSYGLHGYSEDYGSTALNYAATMTTNRKTTMYDLKKVVFQTLNLMLYDDMPATSGGSNAGADGNGHAYSLAYGWDQYSFGANYFGLAFDQMGQVHIVNFRPSMIWSDTHFDTNQLVYTKTLGNTSALTKNVPTAYSNYLKASVFNNDSSISYVKEKVVGNTAYYFVTRNGQLNIYDSSLKKLTGKVTIDGVTYNLSNEVLNNKTNQVTNKNGQYNEGGKWYLYKDGVKQTGFQYIANQNKTVYYNNQGQMQYGQQQIGGKWYLFNQWSGALK
jgi:SEC10/PgrA surface exclusion-like protein